MYKFDRNHQYSLSDFNQPMGLKMSPENRWVKKAATIPWKEIEEQKDPKSNQTAASVHETWSWIDPYETGYHDP